MDKPVVLSEADIALIVGDHDLDTSVMERLFADRDYGVTIVNVADEQAALRDFILSPWLSDRPRRRAGPAFNVLRGNVTHIVTPDPVSKRKARRLRGRAAALAKEQGR